MITIGEPSRGATMATYVVGVLTLLVFLFPIFRIALPLAVLGLVSTGMLSLIFCWNEFLFANVLTAANVRTAPVGLTEHATPVSELWTQVMAAGSVVVLPVLVAGVFIQCYLVRGLAMGAVNGWQQWPPALLRS